MLTIYREGLTITPNGPLEPSEGSYNVAVKLENDNTYADYTITMYVGYLVKGIKKTRKCEVDTEGNYLIPDVALAQNGPLFVSFMLEDASKTKGFMTNALTYIIKDAPYTNLDPTDDPTWKEQVKAWIEEMGGGGGVGIDKTLTVSGKAADAKVVGDKFNQLTEEIDNLTISGLTTAQVNALNEMFKVCAYTQSDVSAQYNAFKTAFGIGESGGEDSGDDEPITPTVTLTSISATYNGGEVLVGTDIDDLTGITVTGTYSDGTTKNIIDYTLSGEIIEGTNTITVSYDGKTTTFVVTGYVEQSGESGELTEEELAQLETMPDAYLSDDGQYLYINPLRTLTYLKYQTASSYIGTNNVIVNSNTLAGYTQLALKEQHEDMFNGMIPYAKNIDDAYGEWNNAGFRDSTDIPDLCYGYDSTAKSLMIRDGIDTYNTYKSSGDFSKRLYDSFRRIPIKVSSSLRVFELTDEVIDALTGSMSTTPNDYGFYAGFVSTPLGGGFGAWSNNNVICSVGGVMSMAGDPSKEYEFYRCAASLNRFYYYIPQENITDLTLNGLKEYLKTKNIKFFHIAKE